MSEKKAMRLELLSLTKAYPGCIANDAVSLQVAPGEIHALLG
jgi:simple sugar transport system ATP-binding protein